MKRITAFFALFFITSLSVFAQKSTPMVDYKGHIMNHNSIIGKMTPEGSYDPSGKLVTKIDANGNIVDLTGKVIGKAPKNGNSFVYYFKDNQEKYTIGKANHTGMCKVTNSKGETVMLLHNSYKQQGACAVHCLHENHCMPMDGMDMKGHKH